MQNMQLFSMAKSPLESLKSSDKGATNGTKYIKWVQNCEPTLVTHFGPLQKLVRKWVECTLAKKMGYEHPPIYDVGHQRGKVGTITNSPLHGQSLSRTIMSFFRTKIATEIYMTGMTGSWFWVARKNNRRRKHIYLRRLTLLITVTS